MTKKSVKVESNDYINQFPGLNKHLFTVVINIPVGLVGVKGWLVGVLCEKMTEV